MRKNKQMRHQGDGMLGVVAVAFVAALTLFFVLLHVEKEALKAYETASIWVAGKEIPDGFVITKEDIEDYFGIYVPNVMLRADMNCDVQKRS